MSIPGVESITVVFVKELVPGAPPCAAATMKIDSKVITNNALIQKTVCFLRFLKLSRYSFLILMKNRNSKLKKRTIIFLNLLL